MKKRLLFAALALVCTAGAYAFDVDEYVFTKTQRVKVSGENLLTNGNFAGEAGNFTAGWTDVNGDAVDAETWSVNTEGVGPNGENVITSLGANEGKALCRKMELNPGEYLVSYWIKGEGAGNTTIGTSVGSNYADIFLNTDGSFAKVASTEDAPVVDVAAAGSFSDEWSLVSYFVSVGEGQTLVFHIEKMATGVMLTNFSVQTADEVYDIRPLQKKIAYAELLLDDENFNSAEDEAQSLKSMLNRAKQMIENDQLDNITTGEGLEGTVQSRLADYLDASSNVVNSLLKGTDEETLTGQGKINRGDNNALTKYFPNLDLTGGNWQHSANAPEVFSMIQGSYTNSGTYNAYHVDFPAGKYFFTAEVRNAYTDKNYVNSWTLETNVKYFVGKDSIEVGPIVGEDYQKYYIVGEVTEDGAFRAGVEWPGASQGSAFYVKNVEVRAFNPNIVSDVEHIQAYKAYKTQWDAAVGARNGALATYQNGNYPWERPSLKEALDKWDAYYFPQQAKGWLNEDGSDAGVASTEEFNDWALYQGVEDYEVDEEGNPTETRKTYQVVRGYQNANNAVKTANAPFTNLATAIDNARAVYVKGTNATGDRATFKAAIEAALNTLTTVRNATSDATREADTATLEAALATLEAAQEAFLNSVTDIPVVDIDFSNNFEEANDVDAEGNITKSYYRIAGTSGEIQFNAANIRPQHVVSATELDSNEGEGWKEDTNFRLGYFNSGNAEFTLGDVLRIGNGAATVPLEVGETDTKVLAQFDLYFGNLSGKYIYVDFRNAADERVAGFSIRRYDGDVSYNDFNNVLSTGGEGLDIRQYSTGVGSSSASNAAICVASNCSHFTLEVDYANKTVQGSLLNGKGQTVEGVAMPFRSDDEIADKVIAKFVVGSNYNNQDRQGWFDNLKIFKYGAGAADFEDDINGSAWASETAFDPYISGIVDMKAAAGKTVIYNLQGQQVKNAAKGFYIINGKKVIVK